jgi:3-oxoadipate enol-lactonase
MWDGFELPAAERFEMRGFGDTPLPASGEFAHADDLEGELGEAPAALVGASFGGLVCLQVAARRPDVVRRLVLLDAPLADHRFSGDVAAFAREEEALLEQGDLRAAARLNAEFWPAPDASTEVRERIAEMQQRAFELEAESEARELEPGPIDLSAMAAETLVVVGEHDKPDFHAIAARLVRELPRARHAVVAGAGHLPALESPGETARLVRDFLA